MLAPVSIPQLRAYDVRRAASTVLISLTLFACTSQADSGLPESPQIETLAELTSALENAGVVVVQETTSSAPELGTTAQGLLVGAAPVLAYEYDSIVARRLISDTIRAGGYMVSGKPVDWPARPNIWATGRLIVVYPGVDGGTLLLLSGLLGDPLTADPSALDEPYPPAVLAAIGAAAEATGILPEEVEVISYDFTEWPDGCLGLPGPDEMCTEAIVPGWLIRINVGGEQFNFRADEVGTVLRQE